jgi:hypothetical protein
VSSYNKIYHDWEFLEDGYSLSHISVGMVADNGDEYYAINADMPWQRVCDHDWLRENVVPHLPLAGHRNGVPILDRLHPAVKTQRQIRSEVRGFILSFPRPQLWGWYSDFDQVTLAWLFGSMVELPPGVPMRTNDVQQEADRLEVPDDRLPKQEHGVHDALADARHVRRVHEYLLGLEHGDRIHTP